MFPALLLALAAVMYRLLYAWAGSPPDWANFSPVISVCLCTAAYLPKPAAWCILLAFFCSDLLLNAHYHVALFDPRMLGEYLCFFSILALGRWVGARPAYKPFWLLGSAVAGSLLFYLVTNTVDWWFDESAPLPVTTYARTLAGWWQSLTIGHSGYPPSWLFLRNALISDLGFSLLFLLTQFLTRPSAASSILSSPAPHRLQQK